MRQSNIKEIFSLGRTDSVLFSLYTLFGTMQSLFCSPVSKYGNHEQKQQFLTPFASGKANVFVGVDSAFFSLNGSDFIFFLSFIFVLCSLCFRAGQKLGCFALSEPGNGR